MKQTGIHIWSSAYGSFSELTENSSKKSLLSALEKRRFCPETFAELRVEDGGFFSIFYAAHCYVLSFHFLAANPDRLLPNPYTVISIAVPRGYQFNHPVGALYHLHHEYENILLQQDREKGTIELGFDVERAVPRWQNELSSKLIEDSQQPLINLPSSDVQGKGFVLYDSDKDLEQFLQHPIRLDFKGALVLLLIPNRAEILLSNAPILNQYQLIKATPTYKPQINLFFPATGKNKPFATVSSLNDSINLTFSPPYCEPMTLTGRLNDHINDWAITPTADRTGYNIGLQFKRTTKRLKVFVDFISVLEERKTAKDVSKWLLPSVGNLIKDNNDYWLVLIGEQIAQLKSLNFSSNKETYLIQRMTHGEDCITVVVQEVFYYDVRVLRQHILNIYKFLPIVSLYNKGQWQREEQRVPWLGHKETNRVRIEESEEYEELNFTMADDFYRLKLIKKKGLELNVCFHGELRRWLEDKSPKAKVIVRQYIDENSSGFDVEIEARKKWRQEIDLNNPVLILPAVKENRRYFFEAPGFQKEVIVITPYDGDNVFHLGLKPKLWYRMSHLNHGLWIGLLIGFCLGVCVATCISLWQDSMEKTTTLQEQTIDGPIISSLSNETEIGESGQPVRPYSKNTGNHIQQAEEPDKQEGKQVGQVSQQEEQPGQQARQVSKMPSDELSALIAKLDGIDFTSYDYQKALNLAKEERLYESKYKQVLKDRYTILCACEYNKGNIAPFKALLNLQTISQQQKGAIQTITADEETFAGLPKKKYNNLQEILTEVNK